MSLYRRRVMEVKHPPNQIVATYNVTSTTSATKLYNINYISSDNPIEAIYIDGERITINSQYTFSSVGEHEVRFVIKKDKNRSMRYFFGSTNVTKVDFSELRVGVSSIADLCSGCKSLVEVKNLIIFGNSCSNLFYNCNALQSIIGAEKWDLSGVTFFYRMFYSCSSLQNLDISKWRISSATDLQEMFYSCSSLIELDLSNWDVSKVTTATSFLQSCSALQSVNLSNWDLRKATNISYLLSGCSALQNVNLTNLQLPESETANMGGMFRSVKTILDVSSVKIGTSIAGIFAYYSGGNIIGLEDWDTSLVRNMAGVFNNCQSLLSLESIRDWNTSSVVNMANMFNWTRLLTDIPVDNWDVSNVEDMSAMFKGDWKLTSLNLKNWDVRKVKTINDFLGDNYYVQTDQLTELDLSTWELDSCETMSKAFQNRKFKLILPQGFGKNCKDFSYLFARANETVKSLDLTKFDMSNATNVRQMLYESNRADYDISTWDLSKVITWANMFSDCRNIATLRMNTEISDDAKLYGITQANEGVFYESGGTGSGSSSTILYYFPHPSFVDKFLPIVPGKWQKIPLYTPTECVSLNITAENINGVSSSVVVSWTALTNGIDVEGNPLNGIEFHGKTNIDVGRNMSTEDVQKEVSFTYMGVTANTIITQYAAVANVVATYNVSSVETTQLLNANFDISNFEIYRIDGTDIIEPTKTHAFATTGVHTVEMYLKEGKTLSSIYKMFQAIATLKSVDFTNLDMSGITSTSTSNGTAYAFYGCTSLENIILPDSVSYLGYYMFYGCTNVTSLTILRTTAPGLYGNTTFGGSSNFIGYANRNVGINKLYVPQGATGYDSSYWKSYLQSTSYCGFTKEEIEIS